MKFKKITGGTEEVTYKKFPWLKEAVFENAEVDITNFRPTWEGGVWEGGVWKGGTWEHGLWKDGTWKGGEMWNNRLQKYEKIKQVDREFKITD